MKRMNVMKKIFPIFMIAVLLLTNTLKANASEEFSEYNEAIRQEQIDAIFNKLNAIAAAKANEDYLKSLGISYRYIKVIDNKGYNRLTHIQELDAIASLSYAQLGSSILSYNFGYGFSLLLGSTPVGLLTDWTLGNIFNVLNNLPTAQISSSGEAIYRIFHTGVTSMTYYYLYNNGWKLIGVGASVDIVRDDYFAGNVNGSPKTDFHSVSFRTSTSGIWRDYVDAYLNNMASYPSYCQVNEIGSFTIRGYSNTLNYTPAYARNPVDLI